MAKYVCPNQVRSNTYGFLMCRPIAESVGDIESKQNALSAYCLFQKYCSCTGQLENTEQAMSCYQKKQNQAAQAD